MAAAVGKVWREQKHILIQAKFSRINGNNKYIREAKAQGTGSLGSTKVA